MGLKTKIGMAMATSAAGAAMVVGGSFALFSDYKYTNSDNFTAGTLKVTANEKMSAGSANFQNMAPGDTATEQFVISNPSGTSSLDEWVSLETTVNDPATGQSLWKDVATSIDSDAGTNGAYHGLAQQSASGSGGGIYDTTAGGDFSTDKHHATWGYTVYVRNADGSNGAVLATNTNPGGVNDWTYNHPFQLKVGQSANVVYSVTLPLAAHNDYQGAKGSITAEVDAVQSRNNWYVKGDTTYTRHDGDAPTDGTAWPYSWQPDVHQ